MSDIFVSYASADRDRARVLAQALTEQGWSVWWDRTIPPGKQFDEVIEEALDSARCVVVLWSTASVASTWVKTEAAEAMRRKILVPVLIDEVKIPLEFRRLQAADLSQWKGERAHEELQKFFQSIEVNVGHGGASPVAPVPAPVEPASHRAEVQPLQAPPVARTEAPVPRPKSKAIAIGVAAFAALVVIAVGYTAYNERVKRVAMEERAERERHAAEEARRAAEEAAARAKAAQEEAAQEAARRKAEDQRRAAEAAARAKAAQEEAARARAVQEAAARAKAQEEAARAARERADRLAEQERKQKPAARTTSMRLSWHDHALRYAGILTGGGGSGTLRATVWDLRSGAQIGNYQVPVSVIKQSASDFVVSGNFSIPRDSVTPYPHVHTSRLVLRMQSDGTLRFIENCPQAGQCYPAR